MALQKPEWFRVDPAKFLADAEVDAMTTLELGACFRLLCRQWIDGFIPDDERQVARLARLDANAMGEAWVTLCRFFPVVEPGKRANRFMWIERERIVAELERRSDEGARAARKRWDEHRKKTDASPMPDPMQEQSRAEQNQKENTPLPPKGGRRGPKAPAWAEGLPDQVVTLTRDILASWPKPPQDLQPPDRDGKRQPVPRPSGPDLAARLDEILRLGGLEEIIRAIAARAVEEWRRGAWIKAPQHWFGKSEDAPFRAYYRAELTNRRLAAGGEK